MALRYTSGPVRIAYDVVGRGNQTLLVTPGWVSHLDYDWATPEIRDYYQRLASGTRHVIRYDKRGTGLSDRPNGPEMYSLEVQVADLRAVLDASGIARTALLGWSQGGPIVVAFAAQYPERVSHLVLYGTYAKLVADHDYPEGRDPQLAGALVDMVRAQWGVGSRAFASLLLPEADGARLAWLTGYQRIATSPQAAADFIAANSQMDVRRLLSSVTSPALVLHRREDCLIPMTLGAYLAARLPRSTFQELEGTHHLPYFGDSAVITDAIDVFVRENPDADHPSVAPEPLSARELEVLGLLAQGHRNQEIAERLRISPATVGRHLANIYSKLGVTTRTAAAAYAYRHQLG